MPTVNLKNFIIISLADTARRAGFGDMPATTDYQKKKQSLQERNILKRLLEMVKNRKPSKIVEVNDLYLSPQFTMLIADVYSQIEGYSNDVYFCQNLAECENRLSFNGDIEALYKQVLIHL
ncbi:hypothetical protein [Crocosphaera chwakensis]|uniref:Uncharacterized protein n=1 Tax=Crocosphaera chwakensis CCY0110 TaxID=391612 RepID=A3IS49_9CHRO|nr:hypothetical protein [Crocosphaera chwakensis]EAZ90727.1 hypothetical protein CY0110_32305 [Crocosphaera chwakensis CCY0110]